MKSAKPYSRLSVTAYVAFISLAASSFVSTVYADDLTVRIKGQSVGVVGDKIYLTLDETGDVSKRIWSIFPAGTVGFDEREGGKTADFATRFPGTYVFFVSTSSKDGNVAQHYHVLEMRGDLPDLPDDPARPVDAMEPQATKRPQAQPATRAPAPAVAAKPKQGVTPQQFIMDWTDKVVSTNKPEEIRRLASLLRQVSNSITTGLVQGNSGLAQAHALARMDTVLRVGEAQWTGWWGAMERDLWPHLARAHGGSVPDANAASALAGMADILEKKP